MGGGGGESPPQIRHWYECAQVIGESKGGIHGFPVLSLNMFTCDTLVPKKSCIVRVFLCSRLPVNSDRPRKTVFPLQVDKDLNSVSFGEKFWQNIVGNKISTTPCSLEDNWNLLLLVCPLLNYPCAGSAHDQLIVHPVHEGGWLHLLVNPQRYEFLMRSKSNFHDLITKIFKFQTSHLCFSASQFFIGNVNLIRSFPFFFRCFIIALKKGVFKYHEDVKVEISTL